MPEHTQRRFLAALAAATVASVGVARSTLAATPPSSIPIVPAAATEVNVKDFGAVGKGDNDTTNTHAARNAAEGRWRL
jgi:hypothetical protein